MPLIAPPPGPGVDLPGPVSAPHAQLEPVPGPSADSASPPVLDRAEAEELGRRIQQQAALIAQATCEFLLLLADFDRREGSRWYVGLKSTAHWLGWACSMAAGTAREHLRVARALPELPLTVAEFRAGRLSYSKVREITRVADRVDEEVLVEMARAMTASQLARTVSSFRAVDGTRLDQDSRREARWRTREDGMVEIRAVLPAETGAELVTALELALDRDGSEPPSTAEQNGAAPVHGASADPDVVRDAEITTEATLDQRRADALHDLARSYLSHEPADRSGEDRHLVIVQVSADALRPDVPAGTSRNDESPRRGDSPRCGILDGGPLEPATAERLACTGKVSLAIADADGEILHLGRSRRLASRAQRRALRLRDGTCTFPGCHQRKHLDAHHLAPWSEGGPTDLDQLALLCRRHHVMVHEGGLRLLRAAPVPTGAAGGIGARFQVLDADGHPVQARWPAMFERLILRPDPGAHPPEPVVHGASDGCAESEDLDPERIAATTGGAGFRLADCVQVLCENILTRAA